MNEVKHTTVIVTCFDHSSLLSLRNWLIKLIKKEEALNKFEKNLKTKILTNIVKAPFNEYSTFVMTTSGVKQDDEVNKVFENIKKKLINRIESFDNAYGPGFFDYIEVHY